MAPRMVLDDKANVRHLHTTSDIRGGRINEGTLPSTIIPSIEAAQASANGKNTITWSTSAAAGSGITAGDTWFQTASGLIVGQWEWSGSAWVVHTIDSLLIANLDAGKITTGTLAAGQKITAGDPAGSRVELDSAGLRKYAADGTTVQVDLTGEVAAFSGLITGSEIVGGTLKTATAGNRIEIVDNGFGTGQLLFYSGHQDERWPGTLTTWAGDGDTGYKYGVLYLEPPMLGTGHNSGFYCRSNKHDTDPALDYTNMVLLADEILLDTVELRRSLSMIETVKGVFPDDIWTALRFTVVDSSKTVDEAGSLARLLLRAATPTVAAPLLVWDTNAAPGAELKYTTDGTDWAVIGGMTFSVTQRTPTSGADTSGSVGDLACDDDYIYTKTSTGWKRAAIATW